MKRINFTSNLPLRIVEDLLQNKTGRDFSDVLIILPNKRPSYYILKHLREKLKSDFISPQIFSIDEFIRNFSIKLAPGTRRLESLNKSWLIFKISKDMGLFKDFNFHNFYNWGLKIADVLEELIMEEVPDTKLKNLPIEQMPTELASVVLNISEIKKKYFDILKEKGFTTRAQDYANIYKNFDENYFSGFNTVYTAGLFAPSFIEKGILDKINSLNSNVHFEQEETEEWKSENIHIHSAFDMHSQVKRAAEILQGGFEPAQTCVVLPKADALIPLLSLAVSSLDKEYNVSMGYPIDRTSPFALIEEVMRFQETKVGDEYYAKDYLALLMNPYIKNSVSEDFAGTDMKELIFNIEDKLSKESSKAFINLKDIEKEFLPSQEIHNRYIKQAEQAQTFKEFAEVFENIFIHILKHSSARMYPFSGEFFERFFEVFKDMRKAFFCDEKMQKDELFNLFRYYINQENIPFSGIPLSGLQILGMLETRNLSFEKVIVLDVQEGVIPSEDKFDPIFPVNVRKFLGLPTYAEREKVTRHHFKNIVNTAKEAHLIYKEQAKDSRSRFIEEIIWQKEKSLNKVGEKDLISPVHFRLEPKSQGACNFEKSKETLQILKKLHYSPTVVDSYLNCPAKFYFGSVLGLKEKQGIEREPDSAEIGTCIHNILQKFYELSKVKKLAFDDEDFKTLEALTTQEVKESFGNLRGEIYLLEKIARFRLRNFFESEKLIQGRTIISTEQKLSDIPFKEVDLAGDYPMLSGRIDRIDQRGQEIFIVDYKTGSYYSPLKKLDSAIAERKEMKHKIKSFQLPMYIYMYAAKNNLNFDQINAAFYSFKENKEILLFDEKHDRNKLMNDVFIPALANILSEILNPDTKFIKDDENNEYCENCAFRTMCR